jgi:uncharacterized protein (TIRG00374 family)
MRLSWRRLLPLIGIVIFIVLIFKIGIKEILSTLTEAKIGYIIIAFLFSFLFLFLQALKWHLILKKQGIVLSLWYTLKLQFISVFYGMVTPGRVGSFVKIFYLKDKIKKSVGACTSSVLLERLLDLFNVLLFAFVGGLLLVHYFSNILWVVLILLVLFFIGVYVLFNRKLSDYFIKFVHRFLIPRKFKERFKNGFSDFYNTLIKPYKLSTPFLISFLAWLGVYTQNYFVALAFGVHVPYFYFITLFSIATVVTLIPITVSGLGTRELTLVGLFSIFGVAPEKVIVFSVVSVLLAIVLSVFGGLFALKEGKHG